MSTFNSVIWFDSYYIRLPEYSVLFEVKYSLVPVDAVIEKKGKMTNEFSAIHDNIIWWKSELRNSLKELCSDIFRNLTFQNKDFTSQ